MEKVQISQRFDDFANHECRGSSALYEYLSHHTAEDDDLLEIASHAREGQPIPNLFLSAVHYLLLKGNEHSLKHYYPSITNPPREIDNAFPHFKDFCKQNKREIISILNTKRVQTNEITRCAYLYPTFCFIFEKVKRPLSLIEIGTSAGLQLLWDQYCYSYGSERVYGAPHSNVRITSRSKDPLFLLPQSPPVAERIGVDLHLNDLNNTKDYIWLKSLIWPEHKERFELFENASSFMKEKPVTLIEGDGVTLLPEIAAQVPNDSALCIFHTHVANQMPNEVKQKLMDTINEIGRRRDVFHLYNNMSDGKLHLDYFIDGTRNQHTIGKTDGHGRWFEWKL